MMRHNQQKVRTERSTVRKLGVLYDLLIFAVLFYYLYVEAPGNVGGNEKLTVVQLAAHALISCCILFLDRFLCRVYRQILRYGNVEVYAMLLAADTVSGIIYIVLNKFLLPFSVASMRAALLIVLNFSAAVAARIIYHYLYVSATESSRIGMVGKWILRRFALVDTTDKQFGRILTLDQVFHDQNTSQNEPINEIQKVARHFQIRGEIKKIERISSGYINRTYCVRTISETGHDHWYTLQRINTNVFRDVDAMMENYCLVTEHLHQTLRLPGYDDQHGSISMIKPTSEGKPYYQDDSGCWRMTTYFQDTHGMDVPDSKENMYFAGLAFGMFLKRMSDIPTEMIHTVIPDFHNTIKRYQALEKAVQEDTVKRVKEVSKEIEFIRNRKDQIGLIAKALEAKEIPLRICHNDCNLNNILFSNDTDLPVAIIDLDTVMPSSPLYDYGDSMRIGTNTARDDEKDLTKVSCDLVYYESYARGYLEACGDMLTKEELELLPFSSIIITIEDGIRFLTDYISGDTYYQIFYPGQNLDRCRTQLKLVEDMEKKLPEIREILKRIYESLGLDADPYHIQY